MTERAGSARLPFLVFAFAALAAAGAAWYRYAYVRPASGTGKDPALARAEAAAAAERVFESTPETRFEDRDLRHRDAAKYD